MSQHSDDEKKETKATYPIIQDFSDETTTTRLHSGPLTFVFDEEDFEIIETTPSIQEAILLRQQSKDSTFDFGYHSFYSKSQPDKVASEKTPKNLLLQTLDSLAWRSSSLKEVRNVESIVESYVEQILQDMKETNSRWDFRLIKCGSYYEGLRVGHPFEFDYMLEIISPQEAFVLDDQDCSLNSIRVKMPSNVSDKDYLETFMVDMIPALRECIRRRDSFRGLRYLEVPDHYNQPNVCLLFALKDAGIMIDLVPCVKFPYSQRHKLPRYVDETLTFLSKVIPGAERQELASDFISNNLYLVSTNIHSRWRISTSVVELHVMKNLHEELKKPLRVLKYLCNTHLVHSESFPVRHTDPNYMLKVFGYKPFIPSYVLKLLFLFHVSRFYNQTECQSPGMYHNDTTGILQLVIRDLKRFKSFINLPVERCHVEINSIIFGDSCQHKFEFVQYLVFRNISRNIGWYDRMVNTIELILDEEITEEEVPELQRKFRMLNYPPLQQVQCYVNQSPDI